VFDYVHPSPSPFFFLFEKGGLLVLVRFFNGAMGVWDCLDEGFAEIDLC
jgi:hypothetical protein